MLGDNIRKIRINKGMSINKLAEKTGIALGYLSDLENSKVSNPTFEKLNKIADALDVSIDRLTGESVSCLIEEGIEKAGISLEELAEKTGISLHWLKNLDSFIPGEFGDYEIGYIWITKIAEFLGIPSGQLRAALARQEIPVYDGPISNIENDFKDIFEIENKEKNLAPISAKVVQVPIIGHVPAGGPVLTEENTEGGLPLPAFFLKGKDDFIVKVKGDSMEDLGINDGDMILVHPQATAENGQTVIARLNEGVTCKRFYKMNGTCRLEPANSKYKPIDCDDVNIIGIVTKIIKDIF